MDDFVLSVRQIGQFPQLEPQPTDVVLIQQGGLGGPYASSTTFELMQGALSDSANTLRANSALFAPELGVVGGSATAILAYANGLAVGFSQGGLQATPLVIFDPQGDVVLAQGTVSLGRDPLNPLEATTRQWVQQHTVWSFNDRTGIVRLTAGDVSLALGDTAATQTWTANFVCQSMQQFYSLSPFVFSFNGRTGTICLNLADINSANFSTPGSYPQAPSPALGDASNNIATTAFVDESLQDVLDNINIDISEQLTGYAPLNSPQFTGVPTVPLPPVGSNDATVPNTAWVMEKITGSVTGVASFNTRTGAITLTLADVTGAGGAPINSPTFTGIPAAPTPTPGDSSTKLATTAFVAAAFTNTVSSFNTRTGAVTLSLADITGAGGAPLASPVFTGTPQAPSPPAADSSLRLATTAWVSSNAVNSFNGRTGAVSLQLNDITAAGGAPLASPTFTGVPAVPTAAPGTNTTQAASTAFVEAAVTSMTAGVTSFNTRTGAVTLTSADITGASGALLDNVIPTCGRLIVPGTPPSATLQFQPYNGASIKINGAIYPFSNTQALNNNCYINGVAGQTLANATTYYVYMFVASGGVLTLDFSITGHGSSTQIGNYGVEIKAGDNTRTLVGIIRTTATGAFDDSINNRLCRSWFNRKSEALQNATGMSHQVTTLGQNITLINSAYSWVQFGDDGLSLTWTGQMAASGGATTAYTGVLLDGTQVGILQFGYGAITNAGFCAPQLQQIDATEGYHTIQGIGQATSASTTYTGFIAGRLSAS